MPDNRVALGRDQLRRLSSQGEIRRILDTSLSLADATLLILYSESSNSTDQSLARHLEQPRLGNYRRVHDDKLIEYTESTGQILISPKGEKEVEERLLPSLSWPGP
ncbi:MAG: hypothetical protein JWR24_2912 [Actinoallomurus sp.]|jgi:hypothetical protein|nr:hypothetical protein [Actinoallomurus sp.]